MKRFFRSRDIQILVFKPPFYPWQPLPYKINIEVYVINCLNTYLIHAFLIINIFVSNARLKFAKNQAKAKQHSETELLLFENYSLSSFVLSSKNNRRYSKKCSKISASV